MSSSVKVPVNLLTATKEERQKFVDSFDRILTDCDGTVWDLLKPFDGVSEAILTLKKHGKQLVFVTNNSTSSESVLDERFARYNFDATHKDVIHPGIAAIDYLRSIDLKGPIYLIGTTNLRNLLVNAGFDVIDENAWSLVPESATAMYKYAAAPIPSVGAVFIDYDFNFTIKQFHRATILLGDHPDCKFIVGPTDQQLPFPKILVGPGPFIKILEEATQRKAMAIGKPGAALRDVLIAKYNITDPKRILFVGDTLEQDVGFGTLCGFQTLAVLSNLTEEQLLSHPITDEIPDFWLPSFGDFSKVFE